jgi:hypothetical protein
VVVGDPQPVMRGLDPRIHHLAKKMDRRVKPGDDSGAGRYSNFKLAAFTTDT